MIFLRFKFNGNKIKFIILYDKILMIELFFLLYDVFINLNLIV